MLEPWSDTDRWYNTVCLDCGNKANNCTCPDDMDDEPTEEEISALLDDAYSQIAQDDYS